MVYRDVSYLIIKVAENKDLGVLIKGQISNKQKRELVIAFINNIDFFSNGINY